MNVKLLRQRQQLDTETTAMATILPEASIISSSYYYYNHYHYNLSSTKASSLQIKPVLIKYQLHQWIPKFACSIDSRPASTNSRSHNKSK